MSTKAKMIAECLYQLLWELSPKEAKEVLDTLTETEKVILREMLAN